MLSCQQLLLILRADAEKVMWGKKTFEKSLSWCAQCLLQREHRDHRGSKGPVLVALLAGRLKLSHRRGATQQLRSAAPWWYWVLKALTPKVEQNVSRSYPPTYPIISHRSDAVQKLVWSGLQLLFDVICTFHIFAPCRHWPWFRTLPMLSRRCFVDGNGILRLSEIWISETRHIPFSSTMLRSRFLQSLMMFLQLSLWYLEL